MHELLHFCEWLQESYANDTITLPSSSVMLLPYSWPWLRVHGDYCVWIALTASVLVHGRDFECRLREVFASIYVHNDLFYVARHCVRDVVECE